MGQILQTSLVGGSDNSGNDDNGDNSGNDDDDDDDDDNDKDSAAMLIDSSGLIRERATHLSQLELIT